MADEKHISRGSNSRSKKEKLTKVPRRGLGVAQLEKMRLEEQQKKDSIEISNFRPAFPPSPNSIPLPPPSQTNIPSPNALFRHTPSVSNSESVHQSSVSKAIMSPRYGDWSTISNGEFNLEGESRMLDSHGLAFQPRVNVSYDTNASVLPLPSVPQRSHQSHQLPSSSSPSLTANPLPSSVLSYRMELPSNQNFRSNNYIPLYPEVDKMVGMKRAYPFSLETPPAPSFNRNFHSTYSASVSKSEELNSCSNRYTVHLEPRNKHIREGPSNSSPLHERNHSEVTTDTRKLNGDFLSLAPPMAVPLLVNSNSKHALSYLSQENFKSKIQGSGESGSVEQPSFNFFPVELRNNQPTTKEETIDLDLRL